MGTPLSNSLASLNSIPQKVGWALISLAQRAKIRTWMAIWFFLKGRHSHEVEMYDEIVLRERRSCQLLLDSLFKMRKSQMDHALMMDSRLSLALPNTLEGIDVTVMNPVEIVEPKKRSAKNEMANLEYESSTS